jgi:quercetin dioxygenase-like cupin family protein
MRRLFLLGAMVTLLASVAWTRPAQQPPESERFTGKSENLDAAGTTATRRRFEPGARTAWHSHPNGQLIFVQEGRGRIQKKGQTIRDMGPGESEYTAPNVVHWHGATPDSPLVHVAVGFGGETRWLQPVTEDEYRGRAK